METVNLFIIRDFSRCILCGRCVQACREIQVNNAIDFGFRGIKAKIVAGTDLALKDSDCVFCGECVQVCPVGALIPRQTLENRKRFEKSEKVRTTCSYCGVGCQMDLTVQKNRIVEINGAEDAEPNHRAEHGELKSLYIIGENPLVSDPDLNHAKKGAE